MEFLKSYLVLVTTTQMNMCRHLENIGLFKDGKVLKFIFLGRNMISIFPQKTEEANDAASS